MKKLYILIVGLMAFALSSQAQNVAVTGADAATNAASPFATLAAAFSSINATAQTGNSIAITIIGNTTEPAAGAILNAGAWTSVSIQPSGGAARTITGAATTHLIDLNGADNVTIDGLNSGGNSLTISNTALGGSSAIRFFNDASNNIIQNSTILASTASSFGVIYFGGGTTTGNDNNNINNNVISAAGTNLPLNGIYSSGTSTAIDNSGNTINANNISDYFNAGSATNGIQLASTGNSGWTITNNKLFQSATRLYTSANTHNGINIQTGSGYVISGNTIGFANSSGTGSTNLVGNSVSIAGFPTSYTSTGTANATRFIGIVCAFTAAGAVSEIQNNTIAGIAVYTSSGASNTNGVLCGISVTSGNANIGTTTGNTIGVSTGIGSLYAASSSAGANLVGINAASANIVTIQNNLIGGVESSGRTSTSASGFSGIRVSGAGNFTVSNNLIGNTTPNNIRTGYFFDGTSLGLGKAATTATGTSVVYGIDGTSTSTTGNAISVTSNTVRGIQISGSATTLNGIAFSGTMTGTTPSINVNSNKLGTSANDFVTYAFANSGSLVGFSVTNTVATTINVNSNDIRGIVHSAAGTNTHTYINASGGTAANNITTIQDNTFTNLNVNTSGAITFISHSYSMATTGQCIINNNSIATGFVRVSAGAITITTTNGSSSNGSIGNYTNNNFSNITVPDNALSAITGFNNTDGSGSSPTKTITGNTFNNWHGGTIGTTGSTGLISVMNFTYWNGVSSLSNNTITNITGRGQISGITIGAAANLASSISVASNVITNLSSIGTGGSVTGITCSNTSTLININNNTISSLASTGTSSVVGITIAGATTINVSKNNICSLNGTNSSSTVNGILVSAGTTVNISNNRISSLTTPSANAANPLIGISVTGGTTVNAYYNTVDINGSSSGALFGSSAISVSTTPTVTLSNNIFINSSSVSGAGLAVAYRRSSSTLTSYGATSERNDFSASTIYTDGTTPQVTLAAYKTLVGPTRDANSISVIPSYISSTCGNADFLKINTSLASQLESGGVNISGITDDFENTIRQGNPGYAAQVNGGGTAPDIGADEFDGMPAVVCAGTPASTTINGAAAVCINTGTTLSLNTTYTELGITYQWASSTTMGGPYTTTLGTTDAQATGNLTVSTYYVCTITCSNSGLSYVTAEKAVTINALPMVAVSPTSGTICVPGGSPVALMASGALTYTWSPTTGLTPSTGASVSANPSASTEYTVTGTDVNGCTNTAAATVNLENVPSAITIAPSSATICAGSVQLLTASGGAINDVIGTGTTFTTATGEQTAFCNRRLNYVGQTIYTAAELAAAGVVAGNITSMAYNISSNGDATTNANYTVKIGHVGSSTTFTSTSFLSNAGYTTVYGPSTYTHSAPGWQVINFSTPFNWDGTSNICVDVRHDGINGINNAQTQFSATTGNASIYGFNTPATGTLSTSRLNIKFAPVTSNPKTWSPTTGLYTDMAATVAYTGTATNTVYASPASTQTYVVTATSGTGCTSTKDVVVTISSGAAITTDPMASSKCAGETATFNVVATGPGLTYQWRKGGVDIPIGGNASAGTAILTLTNVAAGDAGMYDVVVSSTCGSPVTSMAAMLTVNALPTVAVSPTSGSICVPGGSPVALMASGALTYTWSPTTGLTPSTGASVSANPSVNTTYTVTGTDVNGCTNTATSAITLLSTPTIASITATPSTICSGANSQLLAIVGINPSLYSFSATTGTYETILSPTILTTVTDGTLDDGSNAVIPTPAFTFPFAGTNYANFSANTNGWLKLGSVAPSTNIPSSLTSIATNGIYAFGRDANLNIANGGNLTHGPATGGKYVFQFTNNSGGASGAISATAYLNAQIILWGTTSSSPGKIEIIYGSSLGTPGSAGTIGISNGTNYFNAVTGNSTATTTVSSYPVAGTLYTFNPIATYSWSPTTFIPSGQEVLANPLATAVTSTTMYNVTASLNGCTSTPSPITITVSPGAVITTDPVATAKCAGQTATFNVVATGLGLTYQWRKGGVDIPIGGNASAGTATLTLTNVAVGDAGMYDVVVTSTCGSPVTSMAAMLTVNALPTASVTPAGPIVICQPMTQLLTASTDIGTNYQWKKDEVNLGGANSITYTASVSGSYRVVISDMATGCKDSSSVVSLTVNPQPSSLSITPTSASICSGSIQSLLATGGILTNIGTIGTGSVVPGTTSYPNPLSAYYGGVKHQMIYTAAELSSQGLAAGSSINSLALSISAFAANACTKLTIRMKHTSNSTLTAFETGTTQLRDSITFTPSGTGFTTLSLNTPFVWNGTSNLLVEFVHNAGNGGNGSGTTVHCTTTSGNQTFYAAKDNVTGGIAGYDALTSWGTSGASTSKPNIRFFFTIPTTIAWSPTTDLYTDAAATIAYTGGTETTVYAKPSSNITYQVTSTSAAGCTSTASVAVTVSPLSVGGTVNMDQTICSGTSPMDLILSGQTGSVVKWQKSADAAFTSPVDIVSTSTTLTGAVIGALSTDTYFRAVVQSGTCSSANSASVLITIAAPPAAPTGTATQAFCSSASPTVASLMATGASIKWYDMASGGMELAPTTPLVNGTHYYASQTVSGCESTSRLDVTASVEGTVVTTSANTGAGSLRSVVACASEGSTVTIDAGVTSITMTESLNLDKNLMIMDMAGAPVMITFDFTTITTHGINIIAGKTVTLENLGLTAINNPTNLPLIQVDGTMNAVNVTTNQ